MPRLRSRTYKAGGDTLFTTFKKRGLVLPGYKYLGPFNDLDRGEPTNQSDRAAQKHDQQYQLLQKRGINPYFTFSNADQDFINETGSDWGGRIGATFFRTKKRLADWGILPKEAKKAKTRTFEKRAITFNTAKDYASVQAIEAMADGKGSGTEAGLRETPIDKVNPYEVFRGPPTYTFASLPYLQQVESQGNSNTDDSFTYRMTSPYDTLVTVSAVDANVGTGATVVIRPAADASDATVTSARWFNFYRDMYKYYHVISARWHLTFENLGNSPLWLHQYYKNDTDRPNGDPMDYLLYNDVRSHLVGTHATFTSSTSIRHKEDEGFGDKMEDDAVTTTNNYVAGDVIQSRGQSPYLILSGEYRTGDYNREVHLDSAVENWTLTTTNPALPEHLVFKLQNFNQSRFGNSAASSDLPKYYRYMIKIEYLVEFKELKDGLKYPVQRQPASVTINNNFDSLS